MSPARIAAVLLAILTLAAACGNEVENPLETAGDAGEVPAQTASTTPDAIASVTASPEPTAAPEPTPRMVTRRCSDTRENAGLEYEFDLNEISRADAIDEFCGQRTGMESLTCPYGREFAGTQHEYHPSVAVDAIIFSRCGRLLTDIPNMCPSIDIEAVQRIYKGSRSTIGQCFVMNIWVEKFDLDTGPCRFLAYPYANYSGTVIIEDKIAEFGYEDDPDLNQFVDSCPELDRLFSRDFAYAEVVHVGTTDEWWRGDRKLVLPVFKILYLSPQ